MIISKVFVFTISNNEATTLKDFDQVWRSTMIWSGHSNKSLSSLSLRVSLVSLINSMGIHFLWQTRLSDGIPYYSDFFVARSIAPVFLQYKNEEIFAINVIEIINQIKKTKCL